MPLTIEDDATTDLIVRLAETTGVTEAEAVRAAVAAELRARYPDLEPTGLKADKAFFDELSGE